MVLHSSFILHKVFISLSNFDLKQRWESICWNSAAHIMDTKPIFQSPLKQIQRYGHGRALTQANVTTFTLRNTNPFLHSIEIMKQRTPLWHQYSWRRRGAQANRGVGSIVLEISIFLKLFSFLVSSIFLLSRSCLDPPLCLSVGKPSRVSDPIVTPV